MNKRATVGLMFLILAGCGDSPPPSPAAVASTPVPDAPALSTRVRVDGGELEGEKAGSQHVFRGIAYAAAPKGALRWRAPQLAGDWEGVRDATRFGAVCPQPSTLAAMTGEALPPSSEDCLFLNIWTPASHAGEKLPVMVWIHGGGLSLGWSHQAGYMGEKMAGRGVIVVTINYRLGPLGFLAHPELTAESGRGAAGNYGFLDQIAALGWVQQNIAAFGGDADKVTIFGESAGATSVYALMASPLAKGLFHRAIAQSPWMTDNNVAILGAPRPFVGSAESLGLAWARNVTPNGSLTELRAAPAAALAGDGVAGLPMTIAVDGHFMPDHPEAIFARGAQHDVPLIVGTNSHEGTIFMGQGFGATSDFAASVRGTYADVADSIIALYPTPTAADVPVAANQYLTDTWFLRATRVALEGMSKVGAPAWQYHFTRVNPANPAMGAHHAAEIGYVFNTGQVFPSAGDAAASANPIDTRLAEAMIGYWTQFAKTGDPNMQGLVRWPAYAPGARRYLELGDDIKVASALGKNRLDRLDKILAGAGD